MAKYIHSAGKQSMAFFIVQTMNKIGRVVIVGIFIPANDSLLNKNSPKTLV
jgi:hypothetical protein